jgi:hypothetical protein
MRTVEVSRFVGATRPELERLLTPETIIDYEGTFVVRDVVERDDGWVVTAQAAGRLIEVRFVFEEREDGYVYRQESDDGPFTQMETRLTLSREDEGTDVTVRSSVGLRLPLPFADRVAAWKRRGELRRALDRLAADVE